MKYYLLAGEASGDLHGSNLMKSIKELDPNAEFRFWGGDLMNAVGGSLVSHYKERAFMGISEVIKNLRTIKKFLSMAAEDLLRWKPDAVIFIDNPGFNLRIAPIAKKAGIPVHYYISPKIWAWNESRIKIIKQNIDFLYTILPFETEYFHAKKFPVDYVGNPVVDAVYSFKNEINEPPSISQYFGIDKPIIALLAGSRKNEIEYMLPTMWQLNSAFPDFHFVVAGAPSANKNWYKKILGDDYNDTFHNPSIIYNNTYGILSISHAALVTSGTATLETALFQVPQVVCYKFSPISYFIGKLLVKIKFISLVNLIANKKIVPELIQYQFNLRRIKEELQQILSGIERENQLKGYKEVEKKLGPPGASKKAAEWIVKRTLNSESLKQVQL